MERSISSILVYYLGGKSLSLQQVEETRLNKGDVRTRSCILEDAKDGGLGVGRRKRPRRAEARAGGKGKLLQGGARQRTQVCRMEWQAGAPNFSEDSEADGPKETEKEGCWHSVGH